MKTPMAVVTIGEIRLQKRPKRPRSKGRDGRMFALPR